MKRIGRRIRDVLWRSPGERLLDGLSAISKEKNWKVVHQRTDKEHLGIPYTLEEFHPRYNEKKDPIWDALLNGVKLPAHPINHNYRYTSQRIVNALVHETEIIPSTSNFCFFDIKPWSITPRIRGNSFSEADERAQKIIAFYINYKEGIDKTADLIRRAYPCSGKDENKILERAYNEFGLTFLQDSL